MRYGVGIAVALMVIAACWAVWWLGWAECGLVVYTIR